MAMVNHDYPLPNELLIVDEQANPIEGAEIKIYDQTAFEAGEVDSWIASTTTDVEGKWIDPIYLEDARNWVVHVQKFSEYGPVHVEITT